MKALRISLAVVLLASSALAQDDCSTAVPIVGEGSFAYDRNANTESGYNGGNTFCSPAGGPYQAHFRLNSIGVFDAGGVFQNLVGTSQSGSGFDVLSRLPFTPPGQLIQPGDTWSFQVWYRDRESAGTSSNLSNALQVTFF